MTLPSFNAEQSLYQSSRHYRASALASAVGGIRPSDYLPPGSYLNSCYGCSFDCKTDTLTCTCDDYSGNPTPTSVYRVNELCSPYDSDIYNLDGGLFCNSSF